MGKLSTIQIDFSSGSMSWKRCGNISSNQNEKNFIGKHTTGLDVIAEMIAQLTATRSL